MIGSTFEEITKKKPEKSLLVTLKKKAGRNNQGRITVRHRGGGSRRKLRIIDFKRDKIGVAAEVLAIEYDPNRSARIALVQYPEEEKRYILAPLGLAVGQSVMSGPDAEVRLGNALPIGRIPVGTMIHNIELYRGRGGQLVRSAGTAAQLLAKEGDLAQVRLPSGEVRLVLKEAHVITFDGSTPFACGDYTGTPVYSAALLDFRVCEGRTAAAASPLATAAARSDMLAGPSAR